ncbi:nuclear transport factor 2 family protein [Devosia faecipullorum]|uniref:nuclear transport factor 2 family protein n=1 Tax=Devosia faecipullorum TaxID=2755039 RepID=UPI00187B9EE8|nr:nuclear transport factor 2 family protein [Devosia faecipullorum]MBE7734276.1 nuclear transport factor 2 family protein [Devosia faecipullorum]
MDVSERSALSRYLEEKVIAYWHEVDFRWGERAEEHYTQMAVFVSPNARYEGRDQIREFYSWRKSRGARVNVHLVNNFHLLHLEGGRAEVNWICTLFASDGEAPQPSAAPVAISLVHDLFLRQEDGEWLCEERRWQTLFRGGETTALSTKEMARRLASKPAS